NDHHHQHDFRQGETLAPLSDVSVRFMNFDFHGNNKYLAVVYLMFWLIVSTGNNMPMKMVPMKPAIKNRSNGSAKATAVFRLRSRSPSVTRAMRTSSPSSLPLSSATEIISKTEPEKRM